MGSIQWALWNYINANFPYYQKMRWICSVLLQHILSATKCSHHYSICKDTAWKNYQIFFPSENCLSLYSFHWHPTCGICLPIICSPLWKSDRWKMLSNCCLNFYVFTSMTKQFRSSYSPSVFLFYELSAHVLCLFFPPLLLEFFMVFLQICIKLFR